MENKANALVGVKNTKRKGIEGIGTIIIFAVTISLVMAIVYFISVAGNGGISSWQVKTMFSGNATTVADLVDAKILTASGTIPTNAMVKVTQSTGGAKRMDILNAGTVLTFNTTTLSTVEAKYLDRGALASSTFNGVSIDTLTGWTLWTVNTGLNADGDVGLTDDLSYYYIIGN